MTRREVLAVRKFIRAMSDAETAAFQVWYANPKSYPTLEWAFRSGWRADPKATVPAALARAREKFGDR